MATWQEIGTLLDSEYVPKKVYLDLLKEHQELQKNVNCNYYEAYLREKLKREALETRMHQSKIEETQVRNVAGWEYYGD